MMKKMKFLCVTLVVVLTACNLTACNLTACAGTEETNYTEELMGQAYDAVGFPDISNYFERQQLKEIYELRDDPNLICYWYTANNMTGNCGYRISETSVLKLNRPISTVTIAGEFNTTVSLKGQSLLNVLIVVAI